MNENMIEKIIAVYEEDGALIFAARHEWNRLQEEHFESIEDFTVKAMFCGSGGIYQVLKDDYGTVYRNPNYKLLKLDTDTETGKNVLYVMDLSSEEADQLVKIRAALWSR